METKYDSTVDTLLHIKRVNELMLTVSAELLRRAAIHDNSKLVSPEKEIFDEMTPKLAGSTYGSDEYKQFLSDLKPALDNHYAKNSHHPEHYTNGIDGMNLFDLIELFIDWKAASERHKDGNILKSIEINKTRFNMSDQLVSIFKNTVDKMFPVNFFENYKELNYNGLTIQYIETEMGFVGNIKNIPGATSQAKTLNELIESLMDAGQAILESHAKDLK